MEKPFRVLIVDDSASARALLRALVEAAPDLEVCGEAQNGREAVEMNLALRPDIMTMDLCMPEMNGMQAIEEIMALRAVPILVLSDAADAHNAMAAVARGALEVARKPTYDEGANLAARLRMLARIPVIRHIRRGGALIPNLDVAPHEALDGARHATHTPAQPRVIAIAASTGGPQALARILPGLTAGFPSPILIAQHIADGFAHAMAEWLNDICALPVGIAQEGEALTAGQVYLADPTSHITLGPGCRVRHEPRAESDIYRPSCDRLLTSTAAQVGRHAVGVILTGMGRDGVRGMLAIAKARGATIAQDEATSVIFGMNREAVVAGAVRTVLPLDEIAGELFRLASYPDLA